MNRGDLEHLSRDELSELVLLLQRPDKTSRNSSKPPSTDHKERRENAKPGGAKPGHQGHARALSETPEAFEDHAPTHCQRCGLAFAQDAERDLIGEYDDIELPPVRPRVTRHRRYAIRCSCCAEPTRGALPAVAQATPFGPRVQALAVYLKTTQLFSYQRLWAAFADLFGLTISQGALMNIFARAKAAFAAQKDAALEALRRAQFVACDETGVRIEGLNAFHWVFCCKEAVVHSAAFSRAAEVIETVMNGHRPDVWTSDRYSAQQGHAERQQTCLAHLDRKARFADDNGDDDIPFRLHLWFNRAFALGRLAQFLVVSLSGFANRPEAAAQRRALSMVRRCRLTPKRSSISDASCEPDSFGSADATNFITSAVSLSGPRRPRGSSRSPCIPA